MKESKNWKQIKRAKKIWSAISAEFDLDPDEWIAFVDILDSCGFRIEKSPKGRKTSDVFIGIAPD